MSNKSPHFIARAQPVDLSAFESTGSTLAAKYGLPAEVKFCSTCVISNQRPNSTVEFLHTKDSTKSTINFDDKNICDACKFAQKKKIEIDWAERERELIALCDKHRRNDGHYDCVVPGSGGKDSFYTSHILKYKYGMHPLTVTWAPHIYTDWGWRNFQRWIHSGFDNQLFTPNGRAHRLLTRLALENLFHPFQPFMLVQKQLAPKVALKYDIPLIFYGENEAEYGNPLKDANSSLQKPMYFSTTEQRKISLSGLDSEILTNEFGLHKCDLDLYMPADGSLLQQKKIDVHYLGYYLKWHPQGVYYYSAENGGFEPAPERNPGTYGKYASIDDKVDDFHFYTTFIKFGLGHASYDAAQEIRSGEISRDEGVALVKKFDGEYPKRFLAEILNYLSINEKEFPVASKMFEEPILTKEYFDTLTDNFRSPHLWKFQDGGWQLRTAVWAER